jgi:serine/threonine-protein kinase
MLSAVTTQTLSAVQGGVVTLGTHSLEGARRVRRLAGLMDRETRRALLVTALLTSALPAAWALWPPSVVERATALLTRGEAAEALRLIDDALPEAKADVPRLLPLKVAALHQLGRTEDERALLRTRPYQAAFTAPRPLLDALAEDVAETEADPELNEWLALVPPRALDPVFRELARGPLSMRQWGALRWLDGAGRTAQLDLVARYAASLKSKSCRVRAKSSQRLAELGDRDAIEALRELSETPKDEGHGGPFNCGQDEAAEAVRRLKKR